MTPSIRACFVSDQFRATSPLKASAHEPAPHHQPCQKTSALAHGHRRAGRLWQDHFTGDALQGYEGQIRSGAITNNIDAKEDQHLLTVNGALSDLLVINKTRPGSLTGRQSGCDASAHHPHAHYGKGLKPFAMTNLKTHAGLVEVVIFIESKGMLQAV